MQTWFSSRSGDPSQFDLWYAAWKVSVAFLKNGWRDLWPLVFVFCLGIPFCLALLPSLGFWAAIGALGVAGSAVGILAGLLWMHAGGERVVWPVWLGDMRLQRAAVGGIVILAIGMIASLGGARIGLNLGGGVGILLGTILGILGWFWGMAAIWPVLPRWFRGEVAVPAWSAAWGRVPRLLGCLIPAVLPLLPGAVMTAMLPGVLGIIMSALTIGTGLMGMALGLAGAAMCFPESLVKEKKINTY